MLVLTRKQDQEIHVPDYDIQFRVLKIDGNRVQIGIDAPRNVRILRNEVSASSSNTTGDSSSFQDELERLWPLGVRYQPLQSHKSCGNRLRRVFARRFDNSSARSRQLEGSMTP
ncbi:MAG: carbon storage regulator [Planctomycetales bacterium]|nr:carbon storage regulator [Planctomycetales bacterium]